MNDLYKKYPCPAQGHLDFTINNPRNLGMNDPAMYGGEWQLVSSKPKHNAPTIRVHTFKRAESGPIGSYSEILVEVTPRSPNSRWYIQ